MNHRILFRGLEVEPAPDQSNRCRKRHNKWCKRCRNENQHLCKIDTKSTVCAEAFRQLFGESKRLRIKFEQKLYKHNYNPFGSSTDPFHKTALCRQIPNGSEINGNGIWNFIEMDAKPEPKYFRNAQGGHSDSFRGTGREQNPPPADPLLYCFLRNEMMIFCWFRILIWHPLHLKGIPNLTILQKTNRNDEKWGPGGFLKKA